MTTQEMDAGVSRPPEAPAGGAARPSTPASRGCWAAAVFFLVLSVAATWPLATHVTTHLPAGSTDLYQNVWNFWWWRTALLEDGISPYHCPYLYAPGGVDTAFHTHSVLNMLLTLPVNAIWGHVAAYNAAVFMALFLCGLGAYLLVRELVGDGPAAVAGGIVFALFPQHQEQILEHLNLFSCQYIPFTLLFLVRACRRGRALDGILAGVCFALNALSSWHLGLLLILLVLPVGAWYWVQGPFRWKSFLWLAVGGAVGAAILLPFLWPMYRSYCAGEAYVVKPIVYRPIDPAFMVLPPPQSTVAGPLARDVYLARRGDAFTQGKEFGFQYAGFVCFLGWVPLVLAGWALAARGRRREASFWLCVFTVFLLFALGRWLTFLGRTFEGVTLPQWWTQFLPGFRVMRVANRYLIPGSVAFTVLVAMGLARLPVHRCVKWLLAAAVLAEYLWIPFPTGLYATHPYLQELAQDPQAGIVLDLPPCTRAPHVDVMVRQTAHGRPILGGYIACTPPLKIEELHALLEVGRRGLTAEPEDQRVPPRIDPEFLDRLAAAGAGTIILSPEKTREALRAAFEEARERGEMPFFVKDFNPARGMERRRLEALVEQLRRHLGDPLIKDDKLIVWRLPAR